MNDTITKLSKLIGVSYATISRTINRPHMVQAATRKKIYDGMRKHNIFPNTSARNLKLGKRTTIGFIVSKSSNFFFLEFVHAFQMEAFRRGYLLVLHTYDPDQAPQMIPFGSIPLDGIIAQLFNNEDASFDALRNQHAPVVIASNTKRTDFPVVTSDDRYNMRLLAESLIDRSPRSSIAMFATPPFNVSIEERFLGFTDALTARGRSADNAVHRFDSLALLHEAIDTMNKNGMLPDIIMAQNDFTAVKLVLGLTARGVRVPADVTVTGYDNVGVVREMGLRFPTVDTHLAEQAEKAFDIIASLQGHAPAVQKRCFIKGEVIQ